MSINSFGRVVEVPRGAPHETHILQRDAPSALPAGSILADIESVALTANNATYALFGEAMGYWKFFPASQEDLGVVPVWGFARVSQSSHPQIKVGTALYGFWPFAQQVLLKPAKLTQLGFSDDSAHRQALHGFYNMVSYVDGDPFCSGDTSLVPALKPLFATAWLLEDFYAQNSFFGAENLLVTSASSKTALGTAFCIKHAQRLKGQLIGLTSKANASFVAQSGLYDQVVTYDDIGVLPKASAALIDFAGNASVTTALHRFYDDQLKYSGVVGKTHASGGFVDGPLPGPEPQMFFAPDQARDAMARLGAQTYQNTLFEVWKDYYAGAQTWFELERLEGLDAAAQAFRELLAGTLVGSKAYLVKP